MPDLKVMYKVFTTKDQKLTWHVDALDIQKRMRRLDELDLKIDSILEGSKLVPTRNHRFMVPTESNLRETLRMSSQLVQGELGIEGILIVT